MLLLNKKRLSKVSRVTPSGLAYKQPPSEGGGEESASPTDSQTREDSQAREGPSRQAETEEASAPIRVLVLDSSAILRPVLVDIINGEVDMQVCGQAATAAEVFDVLAETNPQVAVVDISLEDAHGLDLVQNLQAQYPQVQVVVFSMYDERVYAERAVRAGAAGYVMKSSPTAHLMEAIRSARRQDIYLSRRVSSSLLSRLARSRKEGNKTEDIGLHFGIDALTDREFEVLRLAGRGNTTAEIAAKLSLKERMVNVYQRRIRKKIGLNSLTELRQFATRWVMASQHVDE